VAAEYYTLESVRDEVQRKGRIDASSCPYDFPKDWQYCRCTAAETSRCGSGRCTVRIGIFFDDPRVNLSIIEITYIQDTQRGLIRTSQSQINRLIEKEIIDRKKLVTAV
jgi:hypothetical protein